ncbi:MAG TPA: SDR family NAD(P)-dependent oxidoreductase [Candidatus Thermoplasmatota archaeon]|nr:SDR family NAD(P)-dependent oxidoreductase [Candidatus Thermoplasmatota archaeon]
MSHRALAVITGATVGIGAATARALAQHGYDLVLMGRRMERLEALRQELRAVDVLPLAFDLTDKEALQRVAKEHASHLERAEVLVNNAGLALGVDPVHEGDPDEWDVVIDTNVKSLLRLTRLVLPHMVRRGSGHIVNLGSTAGRWTYPGGTVYCASKFAVRAISEGIRMDTVGSGVRVTNIEPGMVAGTEFSDVRFRGDSERARKVYEGFEALTPEDVADTIAWCVTRPPRVNVQELVLFPTAQASVRDVRRAP